MTEQELRDLIMGGETLTVEFKGEEKERLPDEDLILAVVCLANTEGGILLIGVEDDKRITGAKLRGNKPPDTDLLRAFIRNKTMPGIDVGVVVHQLREGMVIEVQVAKAHSVVATSKGTCQRRLMTGDGPACVPYPPHDHPINRIRLGMDDLSAQVCSGASWDDLDPLQFERARNALKAASRETPLLGLNDSDFAAALGAVETEHGRQVPTFAGLLLLGREEALRRHVPTHAVDFQIIDAGGDVQKNEKFRKPLIELAELVEQRFKAQNKEQEVLVGMLRLAIPDYSFAAFREAVLNAFFHRDYRENNGVYIQWHPEHLLISSPGGFPDGVTAGNLLTHAPKPRNRRLVEAGLRLGLVEQTARGVDKIYEGQVRYGRPVPDYSGSNAKSVELVLHGGSDNLAFAAFIFQRESKGGEKLKVEEMIALNLLFRQRRVTAAQLAKDIHASGSKAVGVLERLVEEGLVESKDDSQGVTYQFTSIVYKGLNKPLAHARVKGLDDAAREQLVLEHVRINGQIKREKAMELTGLQERAATKFLQGLVAKGKMVAHGEKRGRYYKLPDH